MTARPRTAAPAGTLTWRRVHDVVGPLVDAPAPVGLYVHGAHPGPATATPTGLRSSLVVPADGEADFGSYFGAFPAAQWRRHAGVEAVRLRVRVDAGAVLTVRRSDRSARSAVVEERLLRDGVVELVEVALPEDAGLVWFTLGAGAAPVGLLEASWEVTAEPRAGSVLIGSPTVGRTADVAANVRRILDAPALAAQLDGVLVVDHAPEPIEADLRRALGSDAARVAVVRQPNLGGAGGYSRLMHETVERGAGFALLLDDDVVVEPASLLRAVEFGRRTTGDGLVGLQMLDAAHPAILEAGPERVDDRTFWWGPTDPVLPGLDAAVAPVEGRGPLHRMAAADFAGWWGTLIPAEVIRAAGYALPLFLKWDDAEYALRAGRLGFPTVSLQGAALWHESWRIKDDARTWPAFFHARNRLIVALLHGPARVRTGVLLSGLAIEVKQLLALQSFAVERRQEGLAAVLAGPERLDRGTEVGRLLDLSAGAPDQRRIPSEHVDGVRPAAPRVLAPVRPPRGLALAVWAGLLVVRHLLAPVRSDELSRLPAGRGTWWVLPSFDEVFAPTADGTAYFHLRRDRGRFRRLLRSSVALHVRLWLAWPRLRREYRRRAADLAGPAAWARRFDAPA